MSQSDECVKAHTHMKAQDASIAALHTCPQGNTQQQDHVVKGSVSHIAETISHFYTTQFRGKYGNIFTPLHLSGSFSNLADADS